MEKKMRNIKKLTKKISVYLDFVRTMNQFIEESNKLDMGKYKAALDKIIKDVKAQN